MVNGLEPTAKSIKNSAEAVQEAVESVQEAAERVDGQVAGTVEPGIREIRHFIADLNAKTDERLKRVFWGVGVVIVLQVLALILILTR